MKIAMTVAVCGFLCAPAQAAVISGTMVFDVFADDPDVVVATGSVVLEYSHIRGFALTFNGHTWDRIDVDPCQCATIHPDILDSVTFTGGDAFGTFGLGFALHPNSDDFGMSLSGGGLSIGGSLHSGTASAFLHDFSLRAHVPEPGSLALLGLGLLGLGFTRRLS